MLSLFDHGTYTQLNENLVQKIIFLNAVFQMRHDFGAVSYLPNIFKCLGADALGGVAFFREKSSCLIARVGF